MGESDIDRLVEAARNLPEASGVYFEDDYGQGVDTVKPDVHVRRFAEGVVGRPLGDQQVIDVLTETARRLGIKAYELDWRIWEASRGGGLPYPG